MKSGKKLALRCRQATRFGDYCIKTTINDVYTFDYRVTWVLSLKKSQKADWARPDDFFWNNLKNNRLKLNVS